MKKIIFIVFCCFCQHSYSTKQSDWLTDEETIEFMGMVNDATSLNRTAKLRIIGDRAKPDAGGRKIEIEISNRGRVLPLYCTETDGILIDSDTPVWRAERANISDEIIYTPISVLKELGTFEFCQNLKHKIAAAIFHDQQTIDLYFREIHVILLKFSSSGSENSGSIVAQFEDRVKRNTGYGKFRTYPPRTTVYPQLLIQLAAEDVRRNLTKALMGILSYWNAVDMLYSSLVHPRIKLNIAGIIAPADNFSTPWTATAKKAPSDNFVNETTAIIELGSYFGQKSDIFPADKYDFIVSFVSEGLGEHSTVLGIAFLNSHCEDRSRRAALIRNDLDEYAVGAHELAHLFSANHDAKYERCKDGEGIMATHYSIYTGQLLWSSCAKDSIQNHFKTMRSVCLDNCPRTKKNCGNNPIPVHPFSCVRDPEEICRSTDQPEYTGHMTCHHIICTSDRGVSEFCKTQLILPTAFAFCRYLFSKENPNPVVESKIPSEDGTICEVDESGAIWACYSGRCVLTDQNTPHCETK